MIKFTRRATGHFVMLIEIAMHLITCISGHMPKTGINHEMLSKIGFADIISKLSHVFFLAALDIKTQ